jgi:hypothetical protein
VEGVPVLLSDYREQAINELMFLNGWDHASAESHLENYISAVEQFISGTSHQSSPPRGLFPIKPPNSR